jgi:hypothetical protein
LSTRQAGKHAPNRPFAQEFGKFGGDRADSLDLVFQELIGATTLGVCLIDRSPIIGEGSEVQTKVFDRAIIII